MEPYPPCDNPNCNHCKPPVSYPPPHNDHPPCAPPPKPCPPPGDRPCIPCEDDFDGPSCGPPFNGPSCGPYNGLDDNFMAPRDYSSSDSEDDHHHPKCMPPPYDDCEITDTEILNYLLYKYRLDKHKLIISMKKNRDNEFKVTVMNRFYKENKFIKCKPIKEQYRFFSFGDAMFIY